MADITEISAIKAFSAMSVTFQFHGHHAYTKLVNVAEEIMNKTLAQFTTYQSLYTVDDVRPDQQKGHDIIY